MAHDTTNRFSVQGVIEYNVCEIVWMPFVPFLQWTNVSSKTQNKWVNYIDWN